MEIVKLEKLIPILGRLCVRNLTFDENISETNPIFEELFEDFYSYLHGITKGTQEAQ